MKGSRVQAVVQEMQGEKIDIIPWSEDTATFVVNALQPATVSRVVLDEDEGRDRGGRSRRSAEPRHRSPRPECPPCQPADRLAQIDIMTEADASEKRQREFVERSTMFQEELDVDETLAQLLVAEGFTELEEVAYVDLEELASIEGFDEELAAELQSRAQEALDRREEANRARAPSSWASRMPSGRMPHLTEAMLVTLGKAGIKTLDDLADLATDELIAKKRRRDAATAAVRRCKSIAAETDKGGVLGRIWPERRAGQRDHHGGPCALVRRRAGRNSARIGKGEAADADPAQ